MIEIQFAIREKFEYQNRDKINYTPFGKFRTTEIPVQRTRLIQSLIEQSCTSRKLSIETLMKQIRSVIIEKTSFEYQDMPFKNICLAILGCKDSHARKK